jgi:hypothetical protein
MGDLVKVPNNNRMFVREEIALKRGNGHWVRQITNGASPVGLRRPPRDAMIWKKVTFYDDEGNVR